MSTVTFAPPKPPRRPPVLTPRKGEQRLVLGGATWEQFKTMQRAFGERGGLRVSYLDGVIQFMTVSLEHESRKSHIGLLLEAYLVEEDIEFFIHGNATLESEIKRGKEPDESYCFHTQKKFPDLAIEVAITRGGINTLEIYRRWEIPEIWIWQRDRLEVFHLREGDYVPSPVSLHFPKLNLILLASCARLEGALQARKQFLAGLKKTRRK